MSVKDEPPADVLQEQQQRHEGDEGAIIRGVAFVQAARAADAVAALRMHPLGRAARRIGRCVREHPGIVALNTSIGGTRVVDMLPGDQLPRIC
jgi:hydrogenase maturation factor